MTWTALTATALWFVVGRRWKRHSEVISVDVLVVVVGLHALWDSTTTLGGYIVLAAISLTSMGVFARVAAARPLARIAASEARASAGEADQPTDAGDKAQWW